MVLSPSRALQLSLDVEAFTVFRLMVSDFLYSTQVDFQSNEWQYYYFSALIKVVVEMNKCERPK